MAKTLHIAVNDKVATYCQRDGVIVCGNSDYEIEFAFDSEWSSHAVKTARFIHGKTYEDVVFEGNMVAVPVMRGITSLAVGVFSGNLKTTTPALITCRKSVLCEGGSPSEPTPDVYAQIIELLNKGGGGGGSGNDGNVQTLEEMLQGFEQDPGSVKAYVDSVAGGAGADGGHYTPSVVDNGDGTMTISFTANKEGMTAVSPVTVTLPKGADGAHVIAIYEMGGDDTKTTYKMRFSDGSGYDFDVYHGQDGADGGYYTPTVETVTENSFKISFAASKSGMPSVGDVTITLPTARDGDNGVGISSVVQTTTSTEDGGENIITVTLTNGNKSTFKVKNGSKGSKGDAGNGIKSIAKTSTSGLVDTYTITLTDNTTATFTVTNGKAGTNGTNGTNGKDGESPTVTVNKVGSATTITATNPDGTTSTAQVQDGITYAEVLYVDTPADLDGAEIDKSKVYVCKEDGKQYAFSRAETVVEGVDLVPSSTPSSTQLSYGWVTGEGYCANRRLSSDGSDKSSDPCRTTGYIEVKDDDILTIKNYVCASGVVTYFIAYDENKTKLLEWPSGGISGDADAYIPSRYDFVTVSDDGTATFKKTLAETFGVTGIKYLRISWGNSTVIEVYRQPQVEVVTKWTAIRDFLPTDRSADIDQLQTDVNDHNVRLTLLEQGRGGSSSYADAINKIRNYDKPLYDTLEPYLLSEDIDFDESKVTGYTNAQDPDGAKRKALVQKVYDDYNTLCATNPDYVREVTETFGGICSDGETYVRVYEFCERQGRVQTDDATRWSERKPTIIIVSGIHQEWNGVYSMLEALRCIVTDGALRWIRRNFRIVILPVCNPYSFYGADANGHYNANGIEIHNNFVVDFSNASDATHGTEPLTEVETNYINNVMRTYRDDAVCLLSCHSNATKGANFIWGSVATKMMVNTVLRLVDMMSYAWDKKYDNYRTAVDTLKSQGSNPQDDGDYRCGFANMSTSFGTEAKQALYHGFQGLNVEVYERFYLFDPNGTDAALAVSRGAEAYINLLRLLAVTYDHNDRDKYAPTPAYEFVE